MSDIKSQKSIEAAVELGFLNKKQLESIEHARQESNYPAMEIAIRKGYLTRKQLDILNIFSDPESVVPGYRIDGFLGEGGVGVVYKATQLRMDRPVAIKTINRAAARNDLTPKRFEREARIIGQLRHPNIISAFDFGVHDEKLYLIMEFVDGIDAEKQLEERGRFAESHAWFIARQVCHALDNAKQLGITHRDIKPGNLILTAAPAGTPMPAGVPFVKVGDFGLAKFSDQQMEASITMEQAVSGTPFYMSPEQIQSLEIDHRSDIYSLGTTIWHLISGEPPITGNGPLDIITSKMKLEDTWIEPTDGISAPGFKLLEKMCRHDRAKRIDDYSELSREIDGVIEFLGTSESQPTHLPEGVADYSPLAKVVTIHEMAKTCSSDAIEGVSDSQDFELVESNAITNSPAQTNSFAQTNSQAATGNFVAMPKLKQGQAAAPESERVDEPKKRWPGPILWAVILSGVLIVPAASYFFATTQSNKTGLNDQNSSDPTTAEASRVTLTKLDGLPIFLFNGTEVDPTQRFSGTWEAAKGGEDGSEGIVLSGMGTREFRCRGSNDEPLVNFRFVCGFRHNKADLIEFKFIERDAEGQDEVLFGVSITRDMATLTAGDTTHEHKLSKFDDEQSYGFHQFRIEAQPDYWRVEVDRDLLGKVDKPQGFAGDKALIQLSTDGQGSAHFEGIRFHEFAGEPTDR